MRVSDRDFEHAETVLNELQMKAIRDYHELYF